MSQSGALRERLQQLRAFLAAAFRLIIGDVTWTRPAWIESLRAHVAAVRAGAKANPRVTTGVQTRPRLAGEWRWAGDRELTFAPAEDWPVGEKFNVTFVP
ncbi:MAG TPA: hypothetical protein VEU73_08805 [Gemmatimonadales bacterium]|nr:hypothetical protein [Gemmatimonadales bacterium]